MEEECMIEEMECGGGGGSEPASFDALLRQLERAPRNNVLEAKLRVGPGMRVKAKKTRTFDAVVRGHALIQVRGRGGGGGEGHAEVIVVGP
jgi:hypothetical protein